MVCVNEEKTGGIVSCDYSCGIVLVDSGYRRLPEGKDGFAMRNLERAIDYWLTPFDGGFAPLVAGWVTGPEELYWLAPRTFPPLTPDKVIAWTKEKDHPYLFWYRPEDKPVGYAELNPMAQNNDHLWIGHVLIRPSLRGRGLGTELSRCLLHQAFGVLGARRMSLIVFPGNEFAVRAYKRVGMRVTRQEYRPASTVGAHRRMIRMEIDDRAYFRNRRQDVQKQPADRQNLRV